ncbi:hypothetical protein I302_104837 [Kwoniella bestiolae CBS 10118]|uniref:C2H2-type domain-containing protein n=1 Tax=Kwoniella bestiolae CBS 10118 TaxID=1296100 RepID=A0A1B9FRM4_9TREE|nr:hypothetical protein I302_09094 [Kwoniella bestiolae CBS 10118]OCF21416.1 hypothetical protein I302_09094 [Kwoniella bestiolae CBS 10118]
MSTNRYKYLCEFWNCTRRFDRWSRLEKHFIDHINNNVRFRPTSQQHSFSNTSTTTHSRRRNKASQRKQNRKNRSSNNRSHIPSITPSRSSNPITIDIRSPSLSPDTPSETEMEIEEVRTPPTPNTARKGPRWAVAPRSPTPTPTPMLEEHLEDGEVMTQPQDDITSISRAITPDPNALHSAEIMEDEEDLAVDHSESGDTNQAEETISSPITSPTPVHLTPQQHVLENTMVSPLARLGAAAPRSHPPYSGVESTFKTSPRPQHRASTPPSARERAHEIVRTPNSLDRFIQDALASIEMGRGRSETPCPPPKSPVDNQELDGHSPSTPALSSPGTLNKNSFDSAPRPETPQDPIHVFQVSSSDGTTLDGSTTSFIDRSKQASTISSIVHTNLSQDQSSGIFSQNDPHIDMRLEVERIMHLYERITANEKRTRKKMEEMGGLVRDLAEYFGC